MENNLKGENIVSKLSDDFNVLGHLREFRASLPSISYAKCIDLEISMREMKAYDFPSKEKWQEIHKFSKLKVTTS